MSINWEEMCILTLQRPSPCHTGQGTRTCNDHQHTGLVAMNFTRPMFISAANGAHFALTDHGWVGRWMTHFLPMSWPILASHLPHLCRVTPRNRELPLTNPAPCRRSTCTSSSLLKTLICHGSQQNQQHAVVRNRADIADEEDAANGQRRELLLTLPMSSL